MLAVWSHHQYPNHPQTRNDYALVYKSVLIHFNSVAKEPADLVGGHAILLWSLLKNFPLLVQKYCKLTGGDNSNAFNTTIHKNIPINTLDEVKNLLFCISKGFSHTLGYQNDDKQLKHKIAETARHLHGNKNLWIIWSFAEQPLFDTYCAFQMQHPSVMDQTIVHYHKGRDIPIYRTSIMKHFWWRPIPITNQRWH